MAASIRVWQIFRDHPLCLLNRGTFSIWMCTCNPFASLVNMVGLSPGEA
jgi:hypothetical protein